MGFRKIEDLQCCESGWRPKKTVSGLVDIGERVHRSIDWSWWNWTQDSDVLCGSVTGSRLYCRDCDGRSESWIFGTENSLVGARDDSRDRRAQCVSLRRVNSPLERWVRPRRAAPQPAAWILPDPGGTCGIVVVLWCQWCGVSTLLDVCGGFIWCRSVILI